VGNILEYENIDRELAARLVALRQRSGLTLDDVAASSGISRATLSRIERGDTSPTAHVLGRLCASYNVTMSQLLLAAEEDAPRLIPRIDAAVWNDRDTGFVRTAMSPPARGYDIELVWGELPSGATIEYDAPPSPGMEKHIVLFEGKLQLTLGNAEYQLSRNDCLRIKVHSEISFHNPGRGCARYLVAVRKPT